VLGHGRDTNGIGDDVRPVPGVAHTTFSVPLVMLTSPGLEGTPPKPLPLAVCV